MLAACINKSDTDTMMVESDDVVAETQHQEQTKEEVMQEQHQSEIDRLKRRIKTMKADSTVELIPVSSQAVMSEILGEEGDESDLLGNDSDQEDFEKYCSPNEFAVGPNPRGGSACGCCHRVCCSCFKRVGNMTIIRESTDKQGKRQLDCVLGPCWPFLFW